MHLKFKNTSLSLRTIQTNRHKLDLVPIFFISKDSSVHAYKKLKCTPQKPVYTWFRTIILH